MRKANSSFSTGFISEKGSETQNRTYFAYIELDRYLCLAIAEGYDDDNNAQSAKLAVQTALSVFSEKPSMSGRILRRCVRKAHEQLLMESVNYPLKASMSMVVSDYTRAKYAVCGNSKIHIFRDNRYREKSATQTRYQTLLDEGKIPEDGSTELAETNNLLNFLGNRDLGGAKPIVSKKIKLLANDMLLLSTCSFWSQVDDIELLDAQEQAKDESQFLEDIQEMRLSKPSADVRSYSAAAVNVKKVFQEDTKKKKKRIILAVVLFVIVALIIGGVVGYSLYSKHKQNEIRQTVESFEESGDTYITAANYPLAQDRYEKAGDEIKGIKNKKERSTLDDILLGKKTLAQSIEEGDDALQQKNYEKAKNVYQSAQKLSKKYRELKLDRVIKTKLDEIEFLLEAQYLKEFAQMLESVSDNKGALDIYKKVEQMVLISGDAKEKQEVQMKIFELSQAIQKADEEKAQQEKDVKKEEALVAIDEEKQQAEQAVMNQDIAGAIAIYKQVRNDYIGAGAKEQADAVYALILNLQEQLRQMESGNKAVKQAADAKSSDAQLNLKKFEAQEAVINEDYKTAILIYKEVQEGLIAAGNTSEAKAVNSLIKSLEKRLSEGEKQ